MPKSVLIMDMPESCSKCKFMYEFNGIKKCQLMNVLNNGASKLSQNTFTQKRHDWCPLRELPKKKEEFELLECEGSMEKVWEFPSLKNKGFNACLDEILKEKKVGDSE